MKKCGHFGPNNLYESCAPALVLGWLEGGVRGLWGGGGQRVEERRGHEGVPGVELLEHLLGDVGPQHLVLT